MIHMSVQSRQLLFVKQMHREAESYITGEKNRFSSLQSILLLDICVEKFLNMLVADYNQGEMGGRSHIKWETLWQNAVRAIKNQGHASGLVNYNQLKEMHEVRNLAQHCASIPNTEDVERFSSKVKEFLEDGFKKGYNIDFNQFVEINLVKNQSIRYLLQEVQKFIQQEEYTKAMHCLSLGYQHISRPIRGEYVTHSFVRNGIGTLNVAGSRDISTLANAIQQLDTHLSELNMKFNQVSDELMLLELGIQRSKCREFLQLCDDHIVTHYSKDVKNMFLMQPLDPIIEADRIISAYNFFFELVITTEWLYPNEASNINIDELIDQVKK